MSSSQDSSALPPLVIAEEPEQSVQAAHSAAQASAPQGAEDPKPSASNFQLPVFPKHLPHVDINNMDFEQGFAESCLVGAAPSNSMCTICLGYPRRPVTLDICGHLFCEPCISAWFKTRATQRSMWGVLKTAPCPLCRTSFQAGEVLTWELWQKWAQLTYNAQVVRCPFQCGFQGTAAEVDYHQVRECSKRKIDCPVNGCRVRGPAEYIEKHHFPRCPLLEVYCAKCRLPVRASQIATHDCIARLQDALKGRLT